MLIISLSFKKEKGTGILSFLRNVVVDSRIFSPVTQIKSHSLLIHVSYKTGMLVKGENQTPYRDLFHKNTTS